MIFSFMQGSRASPEPFKFSCAENKDLLRVWPRIEVQLSAHPFFQGLSGAMAAKQGIEGKKTALSGFYVNSLNFSRCLDDVLISKILYQNLNCISAQKAF